jgi:hypothetical protein
METEEIENPRVLTFCTFCFWEKHRSNMRLLAFSRLLPGVPA